MNLLTEGKLPDDVAILVVAGPRKDLLEAELDEISRLLERGGKVFVLLDPEGSPSLARSLAQYGIQVSEGAVVDMVSRCLAWTIYARHHELRGTPDHEGLRRGLFFPLARAVKTTEKMPEGVIAQVLARTSANSWLERDMEERRGAAHGGRPSYTRERTKRGRCRWPRSPRSRRRRSGAGVEPKRARMVVFGDSDFASNNYLNLSGTATSFSTR